MSTTTIDVTIIIKPPTIVGDWTDSSMWLGACRPTYWSTFYNYLNISKSIRLIWTLLVIHFLQGYFHKTIFHPLSLGSLEKIFDLHVMGNGMIDILNGN